MCCRIKDKKAVEEKHRQAAIAAQEEIDKEVADYYAAQRERELKEHAARLEHRRLLDQVLADKKKDEEKKRKMERAEEEEIEVFAAAKRVSLTSNHSAPSIIKLEFRVVYRK